MSLKESDCEALIVCACGEGFAAERLEQKRSARIALRRNGRMSLTRPAAGGESCFAGFFFTVFHRMQHTSSPILPYPKRKRMRMP